jgi:hypothetical protein
MLASSSPASLAAGLFRQAGAAGRESLNRTELDELLSALGIGLSPTATMQPAQATVDLRISLNCTREFGMVISAGLGGIDADLDEGNFRPRSRLGVCRRRTDRCRRLFSRLFQRTLGWQRLAAIARRDGLPLPDQR